MASMARPSWPFVLRNTYPGWKDAVYFNNFATPGEGFTYEKNLFMTNVVPNLPVNPTDGSEVWVFWGTGANDLTPDPNAYLSQEADLMSFCHSNGWKFFRVTITPRGLWFNTSTMASCYAFNQAVMMSTDYDGVFDAFSLLPDPTDPEFYDDATSPPVSGQTHWSAKSHQLAAYEIDRMIKLGPAPVWPLSPHREGTGWALRNKDGSLALQIGSTGAFAAIQSGSGLHSFNPLTAAVFEAYAGAANVPALVLGGSPAMVGNEPIMQIWQIRPDNSINLALDFRNDGTMNITGFGVQGGGNARVGVATLSSGSAAVLTNKVTANSHVLISVQPGGTGVVGYVRVSAITPGTGFTLTSSEPTDDSPVFWMIVEKN